MPCTASPLSTSDGSCGWDGQPPNLQWLWIWGRKGGRSLVPQVGAAWKSREVCLTGWGWRWQRNIRPFTLQRTPPMQFPQGSPIGVSPNCLTGLNKAPLLSFSPPLPLLTVASLLLPRSPPKLTTCTYILVSDSCVRALKLDYYPHFTDVDIEANYLKVSQP